MNNLKKAIFIVVGLLGLAIAAYLIIPLFNDVVIQEELPEEFQVSSTESSFTSSLSQGTSMSDQGSQEPTIVIAHENDFEKVDYEVEGSYQVIQNGAERLLRIDNLDITNGPDLFFVVSNSNQAWGNNDFEIIAPVPANQGSYNVDIPEEIDLDEYQYLLIHCKQFAHTFAGAKL